MALSLLITLTYQGSIAQSQINTTDYSEIIIVERKQKDEDFRTGKSSPIDSLGKITFSGLNYYKPSAKWIIRARLERFRAPDTIQMKTTTERLPLYIVYGKATFTLQRKVHELTIYQNVGLMKKSGYENYLFVPFKDKTSGKETYGGGRYIDAVAEDNGFISLDFNRAYNPYCVYNKKYSCPVPPAENYLDLKVKAGEKTYVNLH